MTATPRERALELLERHIVNGRADGADPGVTARECLAAIEGIGYRLTAASTSSWKDQLHGGDGLPVNGEVASSVADVKAQLAALNEGKAGDQP